MNIWQSGGVFTYQHQLLVLIAKGGTMVIFIIAVTITAIALDVWVMLKCRELNDIITKEYKDGKDA